MPLLHGWLARYQRVQHAVQVRGRQLDSGVSVSRGAGLCGQHCAAMNILEVSIGKLVAALAAFGLFIVLPQMPFSEFGESMCGEGSEFRANASADVARP
jgi:hypothetical protein